MISLKPLSQIVIAVSLLGLSYFGARFAPVLRQKPTPPVAIQNGTVVLLKWDGTNAAFVVNNQSVSPEVLDYKWYYRTDGKGTFDASDPACVTGTATNARNVAFGVFDIQWSIAGTASGYVYYPPRDRWIKKRWGGYWTFSAPKEFGGPAMAITFERDLTKIDANDKRWRFER